MKTPPVVSPALLDAWRTANKALDEARHVEQQARAQLLEAVLDVTDWADPLLELEHWELSTPAELGAFAGEWPILVSTLGPFNPPFTPVFEIDEQGHIQGAAQ